MPVQFENKDQVELLSARFQRRSEPQFALANVVSTISMMPQLRGFWPMSSVNESGQVMDLSGQGRTLSNTGTTPFAVSGLAPYASFDGATQYLSRADEAGLDITGALTLGGWFQFGAFAAEQDCISKWAAAGNQRSYMLIMQATGKAKIAITTDGSTIKDIEQASADTATNTWRFLVGRFTPSTEIAIWSNDVKAVNAAAIPATIYNSSTAFAIGARSDGTLKVNGKSALCFLCAAALSDTIINNLYQQSRSLFY
jgi:hypothetical protein